MTQPALQYLMDAANASEYETSEDEVSERWSFFANVMEQYANEKVNKALANKYSFEDIWNSKGFKESPVAKRIKEYQEIIRRTDKLIQEDGGGVMLAKFEVIAMEVLTNNSK